jgi:hypothetical protein
MRSALTVPRGFDRSGRWKSSICRGSRPRGRRPCRRPWAILAVRRTIREPLGSLIKPQAAQPPASASPIVAAPTRKEGTPNLSRSACAKSPPSRSPTCTSASPGRSASARTRAAAPVERRLERELQERLGRGDQDVHRRPRRDQPPLVARRGPRPLPTRSRDAPRSSRASVAIIPAGTTAPNRTIVHKPSMSGSPRQGSSATIPVGERRALPAARRNASARPPAGHRSDFESGEKQQTHDSGSQHRQEVGRPRDRRSHQVARGPQQLAVRRG